MPDRPGEHPTVGELRSRFVKIVIKMRSRTPRKCQKPGALRRELDWLVAKASVQQRGSDLKHSMGASGRPAHLPSLVHAGVDQLVDGALGP